MRLNPAISGREQRQQKQPSNQLGATSKLAVEANNLFGLKKPSTWTGKTIDILTKEFEHCTWVTVQATWPIFTTWTDCMTARMTTLHRVGCYADALKAPTAEEFIFRVSKHWATDPKRADKVLAIYRGYPDILNPSATSAPKKAA